jgi:transcriptional regulator with XRE-family HTH domain
MESREEFLVSMGAAIKKVRTAKKISQAELALMCDFEKASMSRIESGKTNITILTLRKISNALQVHPVDLLRDGKDGKGFKYMDMFRDGMDGKDGKLLDLLRDGKDGKSSDHDGREGKYLDLTRAQKSSKRGTS